MPDTTPPDRPKSRSLKPLRALVPYLRPYRGTLLAALCALLLASAAMLALPVVAGTSVSLSWSLPAESTAVTGYRLEAGSQPGLADILTAPLGPAPAFAASGVPPGRYYVRVRAVNENGVSVPSNAIVIDVP